MERLRGYPVIFFPYSPDVDVEMIGLRLSIVYCRSRTLLSKNTYLGINW